MLQYDLTRTRLSEAPTRATLPSDAELFVVTAALLLVNDASYSEFNQNELTLTKANVDAVAACIEKRLPEFARDLQVRVTLRKRLADLVGIRISSV